MALAELVTKAARPTWVKNVGGFFSDYFLGELLEKDYKGKLGEKERASSWSRALKNWEKAARSLGPGSSTSETRRRWLDPLFEELGFIFGFSLKDGDYVEAEKENLKEPLIFYPNGTGEPVAYIDFRPWGMDLDSVLEGAGRRLTPLKFMERLLAYGRARWGILTNGRVIRLLKRRELSSGRAFLEIDLENLLDTSDEASYRIFWALFRAKALVPDIEGKCLLDLIDEESRKHAARVGGELRESVRRAVEILVQGFLDEPGNSKHINLPQDVEQVYQQSLVLLYRLLFVLYAESLELLPVGTPLYRDSYSLETLRSMVEDPKENFRPDEYRLWESLSALFSLIENGVNIPELRLISCRGRLFSTRYAPLLESCKVSDAVMAEVIRQLSTTQPQQARGRERISYRELGVEELGAVYEGILQYEPKIAEQDMAVVKVDGNEQIAFLELARAEGYAILETIPRGKFYLSLWGGRRKGSGTYYTDSRITRFLVEQALKPLIEGKKAQDILKLKVLDPAMGSGAFLVAACHYLADAFLVALISEAEAEPFPDTPMGRLLEYMWSLMDQGNMEEARIHARRLVAENCLYGVDLNSLAVELAKVSLWLSTLARDRPLTFLDHRLRSGDSLLGTRLADVAVYPIALRGDTNNRRTPSQEQLRLFEIAEVRQGLATLAEHRRWMASEPDESPAIIDLKERMLGEDLKEGTLFSRLKEAGNLWCALWFWNSHDLERPVSSVYNAAVEAIVTGRNRLPPAVLEQLRSVSKEIARQHDFYHWELEFPEVFFDERGEPLASPGFDAVVGNPPWDIIKPNSREFFSNYEPRFRKLPKQIAQQKMDELCQDNAIAAAWREYSAKIEGQSRFIRSSTIYQHYGGGDLNSYKVFLERFLQLTKHGGVTALVVPSGLTTDEGSTQLRKLLFDDTRILCWYSFENRQKVFPIDSRFKFILLAAEKGSKTESFPCFFYRHDLADLETEHRRELKLEMPLELVRRFSPETLSIMEFRSRRDLEITQKIYDKHPLLGENVPDAWNIKLAAEFHMTGDSHLFNTRGNGLVLYEGKMIHQFDPFYHKTTNNPELPRYWIKEEKGLRELARKYLAGRGGFMKGGEIDCMNLGQLSRLSLPCNNYRLAYRAVASSTNERTMIAAILPPRVSMGNSLIFISGLKAEWELLYLCSALNSFVVDFALRSKVSANLNMFFVEQLPIPRLKQDDPTLKPIVERAARLCCRWPEFDGLAKACGLPGWTPLTEEEVKNLRAELDALMAHLYGLDEADMEQILFTFPLVREEDKIRVLDKMKTL
jgi:hypothetical protein